MRILLSACLVAVIAVSSRGADEATDDVPAYNRKWGEGRGFKNGQTLPDIPLYDLDGNEVRFGAFLGKQYIIYGWASW